MNHNSVENILDLFEGICIVRFYIIDKQDEYEFNLYEIPDEIYLMKVTTIDDPFMWKESQPLCLNISLDEFTDYEAFKAKFNKYLI